MLAAWYLAEPQKMGPPTSPPQPAGGGDRNAIPLYDFPSQRVVHHFLQEMPIRASALRTLGAYANVFAIESFMDELAAAAGADPVAFRLAHLKDPARQGGDRSRPPRWPNWKPGEASDGRRGRGIGFSKYKNLACYVAVVAEVEIDRASGEVRVPRVWAAIDSGLVINPDGLTNQIEGGIIQSASWTLMEEVRFDKNGILSRDWASYPILTMPDVPKVEVELINRPGRTRRSAPAKARRDRRWRRSPMPSPMRPASGCATCRSMPPSQGAARLDCNAPAHQNARIHRRNQEEAMATNFILNGKPASTDAPPQTPLLWVIREGLNLTGTKFGCGTGLCGACMVHIDGKRAFRARPRSRRSRASRSPRSKACRRNSAIRCRRRGLPSRCRNAATASPARS